MGSGWLFSSPLLWLSLAVGPQSWNLKESSVSINCIFTNDLLAFLQSLTPPHGVKPQPFLYDHFNPSVSTATEAAPTPLASHSAKPQLMPMLSSCLQNQNLNHTSDSYTLQSSSYRNRSSIGLLWSTVSVCWILGNTPGRFHLNYSHLLLLKDDFPNPVGQHQLSQENNASFCGSDVFYINIDNSNPAVQNHMYLIQNITWKALIEFLPLLETLQAGPQPSATLSTILSSNFP